MPILTSPDFTRSCLKFPEQSVLTRETTKFIEFFEEKRQKVLLIFFIFD